eukprot:UN07252
MAGGMIKNHSTHTPREARVAIPKASKKRFINRRQNSLEKKKRRKPREPLALHQQFESTAQLEPEYKTRVALPNRVLIPNNNNSTNYNELFISSGSEDDGNPIINYKKTDKG